MTELGVVYTPPRVWHFFVDGIPPTLNDPMNWAKRARIHAAFKADLTYQVLAVRPDAPLQRARVTCTLMRVKGREKDRDNAYTSVKCLVDSLVLGRLIVDDRDKYIDLLVRQERGTKRGVEITVEEIL